MLVRKRGTEDTLDTLEDINFDQQKGDRPAYSVDSP